MSRLSDQRGFTLMELMVATTLFMVILLATLASLDGFQKTTRAAERQNEAQGAARTAIDRLATELRNAGGQAASILKAGSADVVFSTVDTSTTPTAGGNEANLKYVRYCQTGTTLVRQQQTWTTAAAPTMGATTLCPGTSPWSASTTVVENVRNTTAPCAPTATVAPCPIFTYDDSTPLTDVRQIGLHLIIDVDTVVRPTATRIETGVAIRNQVTG
ncbi:MAG: hypothetical protein QOE06_2431 [Thermoleophilaceae bacterium]|jgi:prepilin-type N-terminal cleavage/methylation domain-containing protein|nr:hypothetical protein [Thermoleophilaceae bacterium]